MEGGYATTPEAMMAEFLSAFSDLDLDRLMACFAPDATAFFPSAVERREGPAAIRQGFATTIARVRATGGTRLVLEPQDLTVQLLDESAVVTFRLTAPVPGRRTFVLRRRGGIWQIVHLHASNVPSSG